MIRTITIASAILLTAISIVHAADREIALPNLGSEHSYFQGIDMNTSPREYQEIYNRNRRIVSQSLRSYSINALEVTGIPRQGILLMGAAYNLATDGARLDLNKSKTLALELNDVGNSERAMYLRVNLDW